MSSSSRNIVGSALVGLIISLARLSAAQEFLPAPPADRTAIYILEDQNKLVPLRFEQGQTPLHPNEVAKSTKTSYIELKGEQAPTIMRTDVPRIFLFTFERQGTHPPFIVCTAIAQKGMRGFAIDSDQIIKPTVRVLTKDGDQVFMEMRPRNSLIPGEYAIIGDDLARIATFRVVVR